MSAIRRPSRRQFVRQLALGSGALALGGERLLGSRRAPMDLPLPQDAGIDHIVVVMMENRSFDHFLGWVPGWRTGGRRDSSYTDSAGVAHCDVPLAPDYQGCGHPDPDHSYEGGRVEYNGGACDGWLRAGDERRVRDRLLHAADLAFFGEAAPDWTTCDRYFSAIMAPTFPNRIYQHAAQTDRIDNTFELSDAADDLGPARRRGLDGRYYFSDVPFLALWGTKYLPIARPFERLLARRARPARCRTSPSSSRASLGEASAVSNDDHPHADIRNGQAFLKPVYHAVTTSPAGRARCSSSPTTSGAASSITCRRRPGRSRRRMRRPASDGLLGFRVPCVVVSPFARRRARRRTHVLDHTSILR